MVPPPSIATAGSPTNCPVALGIDTFLPKVAPPSVETANAHTREARASIQPATTSPLGPVAIVTSLWLPLPVSSFSRMFLLNVTGGAVVPQLSAPPVPPEAPPAELPPLEAPPLPAAPTLLPPEAVDPPLFGTLAPAAPPAVVAPPELTPPALVPPAPGRAPEAPA